MEAPKAADVAKFCFMSCRYHGNAWQLPPWLTPSGLPQGKVFLCRSLQRHKLLACRSPIQPMLVV
jgi:hypothetical protein